MLDEIGQLVQNAMRMLRKNKHEYASALRNAKQLREDANKRYDAIREQVLLNNPFKNSCPIETNIPENFADINKPEYARAKVLALAWLRHIDMLTFQAAELDIQTRQLQQRQRHEKGRGLMFPGEDGGSAWDLLDDFEAGETAACGGKVASSTDDEFDLGNISARMDSMKSVEIDKRERNQR